MAHALQRYKCRDCLKTFNALAKVEARYTWRLYAQRMMTLSRIYGFWKFVSNLEREETVRYLHMFHYLQFRPLARAMA